MSFTQSLKCFVSEIFEYILILNPPLLKGGFWGAFILHNTNYAQLTNEYNCTLYIAISILSIYDSPFFLVT
jgi:hypothetical protein